MDLILGENLSDTEHCATLFPKVLQIPANMGENKRYKAS